MPSQHSKKPTMDLTHFDYHGKQTTIGVFGEFKGKLPLLDAYSLVKQFNSERGTNLQVISPQMADYLLTQTENWKELAYFRRLLTDALIAYEKGNNAFGAEVVFAHANDPRMILSVPEIHRGKEGIALVVIGLASEDFQRDGKDIRIEVPESRLIVVPDFPPTGDWLMPHPETTIPHGNQKGYSNMARLLFRDPYGSYVGPVVRSVDADSLIIRHINVSHSLSEPLGVFVEVLGDLHETAKTSKYSAVAFIPFGMGGYGDKRTGQLSPTAQKAVKAWHEGNDNAVVQREFYGIIRTGYLHTNPDGTQGGFVELSASVGSTVYLAPDSAVLDNISVSGKGVTIHEGSVLAGNFRISGDGIEFRNVTVHNIP